MKVILLERIGRTGTIGDEVNVKDGFARNFLLPQGKALRATEANRKRFENERAHIEQRNEERRNAAAGIAEGLNGRTVVIIRQAGETGQLYGSVAARDVVEALASDGFIVQRNQVDLADPIKSVCTLKSPFRSSSTSPVRPTKRPVRPLVKTLPSTPSKLTKVAISPLARLTPPTTTVSKSSLRTLSELKGPGESSAFLFGGNRIGHAQATIGWQVTVSLIPVVHRVHKLRKDGVYPRRVRPRLCPPMRG
jgi:ribosomal protein L9